MKLGESFHSSKFHIDLQETPHENNLFNDTGKIENYQLGRNSVLLVKCV